MNGFSLSLYCCVVLVRYIGGQTLRAAASIFIPHVCFWLLPKIYNCQLLNMRGRRDALPLLSTSACPLWNTVITTLDVGSVKTSTSSSPSDDPCYCSPSPGGRPGAAFTRSLWNTYIRVWIFFFILWAYGGVATLASSCSIMRAAAHGTSDGVFQLTGSFVRRQANCVYIYSVSWGWVCVDCACNHTRLNILPG